MASTTLAMNEGVKPSRLFLLSCIALCVTAMTFAIRAGMLNDLGAEFSLNKAQLGWTASMAFFGFPAATVLGGLLYNSVGPRKIMIIAFLGHILGLLLTIFAGGFWGLMISTFCVGFANGAVEAACNPMIANMYTDNKTTMLNKFHVWFPGGIVVGSLAALLVKKLFAGSGSTWQMEIAVMLIPTIIYGWMVFTTKFPDVTEDKSDLTDTGLNLKALVSPLFIFMCVLMTITATTELGTQQWVGSLLESSGANPLIILAIVTGLMAIGRYFAGPLVHALNPTGVLLFSAVVTTLGVFLLSIATGGMTYLAAIVFAIGVCYFWPTMVGFIAEYMPKTGALGMSIIGGVGMMGLAMWQPVIGGWIDSETAKAEASGAVGNAVQLAAGQATLGKILLFPIVLILAFGILFALRKKFTPGVSHG
ncbi:MFS transporter [Hellea balneolensis]|uniref:MFS transporter n=1 Tax=Hellea balneolensis TaxID=287478 RepID=UPI0003FDF64E|nr:MFS transporter [Hellea balneolensis]